MQDTRGWDPSLQSMRLTDALRPFAASLSQQIWDRHSIERHLALRFPDRLQRLAKPLATALVRRFPRGTAPDAAVILGFLCTSPAAMRIWTFVQKTGRTADFPLDPPRFLPDPALPQLPLPRVTTTDELADWLTLTPDQLTRFADLRALSANTLSPFAPHYRHHLIPKRDGTLRLIEEPKPFLKRLQRRILHGILDHIPPHDAAFGFRRGRTCIAAAARHAGEQVVVGFDLADFFPRIGFARVYSLFRTLGYPAPVARALTGLCTSVVPHAMLADPRIAARGLLPHRHLPQGAPTSPALANLAALSLDRRLAGLARSLDAAYTRYADDLAFSGDRRIAPSLLRAVPDILRDEGLRLNAAKTRVQSQAFRQTVTGLAVNQRVNIPRPAYDLLKATIHRLADPADPRRADPAFRAHLSGRISWVEQVNPARGLRLRAAFDRL